MSSMRWTLFSLVFSFLRSGLCQAQGTPTAAVIIGGYDSSLAPNVVLDKVKVPD